MAVNMVSTSQIWDNLCKSQRNVRMDWVRGCEREKVKNYFKAFGFKYVFVFFFQKEECSKLC